MKTKGNNIYTVLHSYWFSTVQKSEIIKICDTAHIDRRSHFLNSMKIKNIQQKTTGQPGLVDDELFLLVIDDRTSVTYQSVYALLI